MGNLLIGTDTVYDKMNNRLEFGLRQGGFQVVEEGQRARERNYIRFIDQNRLVGKSCTRRRKTVDATKAIEDHAIKAMATD
ncbi:hypothetical protein CCAX7_56930 [Capsulimonas corticalis]|uniref:Uncharacterized protein n=1 Tax=Capsulimonas corticalis TaxID=2219043 RepID=A0A402D0D0_9BACT|nr:hypothetical protein CCAX7_56930 [Capsulimonas corticalis]